MNTDEELFEENDESLILDLESVEEQTSEAIPKGTYDAVIEELEYGLSKNSSKPMWTLTLVITNGEYSGRKLFTHLSFSPAALPNTKGQIKRIAPELITSQFNPKAIASSRVLINRPVRVKTKLEAYEGEMRTKIASFAAVTGGVSDGFDV